MFYTSTRKKLQVNSAQAIIEGLSVEGGLFVPNDLPKLSNIDFLGLIDKSYMDRAKAILKLFLTDFSESEIDECVKGAYDGNKFLNNDPAPLYKLNDHVNILELWHGPTCAFKDMALQLLPYLLTKSAKKTEGDKTIVILVATSGDTGKAALEGFKDVENTKILVFFPEDGVSAMQKLQMTTQEGENVFVCGIVGNFDDAQTGVKKIFTNDEIKAKLFANNMEFSSANSINWGRLVPQIVYYFSAYCDMIKNNSIMMGDKINVVVPTGNFGNILAAYYAKQMGLPIEKLICASNKNNILTDFIETGIYDRNRDFYTTSSPSMDILISSNLERLLYDLNGCDTEQTAKWMKCLETTGKYEVDKKTKDKIANLFFAGYCDDVSTAETINDLFLKYNYLCDTHTAVAVNVYQKYQEKTGDTSPTLIVSTASPYKFSANVLAAIDPEQAVGDEIEMAKTLETITKTFMPAPLVGLENKNVRFTKICNKDTMKDVVFDMLKII